MILYVNYIGGSAMAAPSNTVSTATGARHRGPNLAMLATIFTVLFNAGLYFVVSFSAGKPHFPGPWESAQTITDYFRENSSAVLMCAFLHFGASIPLGIFTATVVSRLYFLGVRAAGSFIALFGGLATCLNLGTSALILWVMAYPGVAQDAAVLRALYYVVYAFGGVGYSAPLGLLIEGVSIPAAVMRLLPKWLVVFGLVLAVVGELSWFNLIFPKALFLIPLTRFPGFVWLIAAGLKLPKSTTRTTLVSA
jgi:hypothetical protein